MKQVTSGDRTARRPRRELMDDRLLGALLERSRDQAGGLRLTSEGSMLGSSAAQQVLRAVEVSHAADAVDSRQTVRGFGLPPTGRRGPVRRGTAPRRPGAE